MLAKPLVTICCSEALLGCDTIKDCLEGPGVLVVPLDGPSPVEVDSKVPCLAFLPPGAPLPDGLPGSATVCVLGGPRELGAALPHDWLHLPDPVSTESLMRLLEHRWPLLPMALEYGRMRADFDAQAMVLDQLTEVAVALSTERNYRQLLDLILSRALLLACCDGGSLYIKVAPPPEREGQERPHLRFTAAMNHSVSLDFKETEIPITTASLAGYVAKTGKTLLIEDAYALPPDAPYSINKSFDRKAGYRTKSLLVIPMTNHRGEITGVLQLINKKRDPAANLMNPGAIEREVVPFDDATRKLMEAVGSLAAVAIDNNRLYESIERLFEGFVKASVTAIEQRDPTTSGHSLRVSILTVGLAECVNRTQKGPLGVFFFNAQRLRELRYASLLHDFGKVGVREQVLVKAKKLYPHEMERILTRLELARLFREREVLSRLVEEGIRAKREHLERILYPYLSPLPQFKGVIERANEPTVLPEGDFSSLQEIARIAFADGEGGSNALLDPEEVKILSIRKGSLTEVEREEIESHVSHTFQFLKQIPWTEELRSVPEIAFGHHEKLNGRGYPRGIGAQQIPIQSKIMTVADIFDALSAADRPYKKAVPIEKALEILDLEVRDGLLDRDLVDLFIEAKVFEKTLDLRAGARL